MKTADVEFEFPVLGFTPDGEMWGFPDRNSLTSCGPRTLKLDMERDMELVDGQGRRWVVRSIQRIGLGYPLVRWLFWSLLSTPQYRIEHDLEEATPLPFEEVRRRAVTYLEGHWEDYCAEDEREEVLVPLLARLHSSSSAAEVFELLGLDSFMAY